MGLLTDSKLNSGLTTVPEPVRNYLELASGDRIEWHIDDGRIFVEKMTDPEEGR